MKTNRFSALLLCASAAVLLAGCQTTAAPSDAEMRTSKIDSVLERAASSAAARGESGESLMIVEKMYKRNSSDPDAALRYAHALRGADHLNRAAAVLAPFADDASTSSEVKTEFAAIQLALGDYHKAERYAQKAVLLDPQNHQAFHYLGIALDAQGMHKEAERAFRKGLDHWQGDPAPIMNNLALNLASQGFVDEALEILQKAQAISPDRIEIERNLRIVRALMQSGKRRAPKPDKKPDELKQEASVTVPADNEPAAAPAAVPVEDVAAEPAPAPAVYGPQLNQ